MPPPSSHRRHAQRRRHAGVMVTAARGEETRSPSRQVGSRRHRLRHRPRDLHSSTRHPPWLVIPPAPRRQPWLVTRSNPSPNHFRHLAPIRQPSASWGLPRLLPRAIAGDPSLRWGDTAGCWRTTLLRPRSAEQDKPRPFPSSLRTCSGAHQAAGGNLSRRQPSSLTRPPPTPPNHTAPHHSSSARNPTTPPPGIRYTIPHALRRL
jgi:hypothetical protein